MKIFLVLLLACISITNSLYSQKFKKPIDYRFKNGENGYISFFSKNITFPVPAIKNGTIGNSIARISLNPKGEINGLTIINPIDSIIDNEVLRVIDLSKSLWIKCDTINQDQVFYIQVAFSLLGFQPNLCRPKTKEIMKLFPEPILITLPEPLLGTLSKEDDSKIPLKKSEELSEKANSDLDIGKFDEALLFINELIKRDPFNRDLYKVRIMINIRLNRPELVDQDDNKIFNFAEGFSLDELNKDQDL
ncbi:MAG: hypothetical protein NTV31_10650 [Bacteroidia bacterium]|nr:hypothetical protein [Bacteroidia bacterium]